MSAADQNMEGMRMALDAVARESARAGALQAQLDRALQDVHHLRQKEQAMLGEFDHRVARGEYRAANYMLRRVSHVDSHQTSQAAA